MSEQISVGIVGNGITGKATALQLSERFGEQAVITMYDNYQSSITTRPVAPSHIGPIGLEVQSGNLWNGYDFKQSTGGTDCDVTEAGSVQWLQEFARRSNEINGLTERQLDLYLYGREGLDYYLSRVQYASHITQQGNLRLFRSPVSLQKAAGYVARMADFYDESPKVLDGAQQIISKLPRAGKLHIDDYAGGIYYPEDATGDALKIQLVMDSIINIRGIKRVSAKVTEAHATSSGASVSTKNGKRYAHDLILLCAGVENEEIAGIDDDKRWTYPFIGRRQDLLFTEDMGFDNTTIGLDDECFIFRQATDGRIQAGGTVIIRDRKNYNVKQPANDSFINNALSKRFGKNLATIFLQYGVRAMTQDDLPYMYNPHQQESVLLVNPTGHMGFIQAPALGRLATDYAQIYYEQKDIDTEATFDGSLSSDQIRTMYRRKGPRQQPIRDPIDRPVQRRGSRSNFVALRRQIQDSGKANAKKPLSKEQRIARRRKR